MSNRFHSKWHRRNHHTYGNATNPDASHDPIANQEQPFLGEFILAGALSACAPLSAYAGHFYSNNTAICAIAGKEGLFVTGDQRGMQIYSTHLGISAYSPRLGISVASPNRALSANAGYLGLDVYSNNVAISAQGSIIGLEVRSPVRAISAFGNQIGLDVYSNTRAISAFGNQIGLDVYSNRTAISAVGLNTGAYIYSLLTGLRVDALSAGAVISSPIVSLSTGGGGYNVFNSRTGIYCIPLEKNVVGTPFPLVFAVNGNSYFDGSVTITGDLSTLGRMTYLDTKVVITSSFYVENKGSDAAATIIQTGAQPILVCYDKDESLATPSFIVDGNRTGFVGVNVKDPVERMTINGNLSGFNERVSLNAGVATGSYSAAFGTGTRAIGTASFAEGTQTRAAGFYSHAEGQNTFTGGSATASHAEGINTVVTATYGHAEGGDTRADGSLSHAEGSRTEAKGTASHAAGFRATAGQNYTYAWSDGNLGTLTQNVSTTKTGQYMVSASGGVFIPGRVGIGIDNPNCALTIMGTLSVNGLTNVLGSVSASANIISDRVSATSVSQNSIIYPAQTNTVSVDLNLGAYQIYPIAVNNTTITFSNFVPGRSSYILLSSIATTDLTINPTPNNLLYLNNRPTTLNAGRVILFQINTFGATVSSVTVQTTQWP